MGDALSIPFIVSWFLRIVELWVSVGRVPVRVELKALNVEVRKSLMEIIKSRQWRV